MCFAKPATVVRKKPQIFHWNHPHPLMTSRSHLPRSCRAGCWAGEGCGSRGCPHPMNSPLAPQWEWSRPRFVDQGQSQPCKGRPPAMAHKPKAQQGRHGSNQERGMARCGGEGQSQDAAMQLRRWRWLPNPGSAGAGVTVRAWHAHTNNPNQRTGHLSVENCILKNNHPTTDLSSLERATKALGS